MNQSAAKLPQEKIPNPTEQQQAASNPSASVWVSASAGSGKTTILTNRVIRLLLADVESSQILCLTFTRAAAAEMSLRVMEKLSHWAVCGDNELSASLEKLQGRIPRDDETLRARRLFAKALDCPGGMRIRTLHAFCQEILGRFPIESNLAPHFAVIDENDAEELKADILTELLREIGQTPGSELAKSLNLLIGSLGELGLKEVMRQLLRENENLATATRHHGGMEAMIARMRSSLGLGPEDTERSLRRAGCDVRVEAEADLKRAATVLLEGTKSYRDRAKIILTWLIQNIDERLVNYKKYQRCYLTAEGELFKKVANDDLIKKHPDLDLILEREATRLQGLAERYETISAAELTEAALRFGETLNQRYASRKRARAMLDYDDLVNETLHLLQRPTYAAWVLHKLDNGLSHLLVDEAQDTSRTQWRIVQLLADEFFAGKGARDTNRTLFVVGDEKQSIYSFQNADPEAFAKMRDYFKNRIESAGKKYDEIPLHVSFRSAPAVLKAVDRVFEDPAVMQGVSDTPVEHISFKKKEISGRVELWPLIQKSKTETEEEAWALPLGYETERDPQVEMANAIALTIKDLIADGESLPGTDHPVRPRDIMILLRNRGRFADLMVRALKQEKIDVPVMGVDRMHLMAQLPVKDLLALIQFVLLTEDDLNLAELLRGPLLNLSEDDLMHLAVGRDKQSLWSRLKLNAMQGHIQPIHDFLTEWLNRADRLTPFAFLTRLLNEPCPASRISGRHAVWKRLGLDALDPIEELLNAAQNFSLKHAPSLQHFIHWLTASDTEIKRELDSGIDTVMGQVRIMTVHASKGLEAPIVFLPDTTSVPRMQNVPRFLWDEANCIPYYIPRKPDAGLMRTLWNRAREKQFEEYRRLLYVAMTRASHRLYIGGWEPSKKEGDSEGCWYNLINKGLGATEAHAQNAPDGVIVWEDPPVSATDKTGVATTTRALSKLPKWAFQKPPTENVERVSSAPSRMAETPSAARPDQAYARGKIIHRLLQSLPDVDEARREDIARNFLAQPRHNLTAHEQDEIRGEVLRLIITPDFAPLFGTDSRAEVPLTGLIDGQSITGQVDRLVVKGQEVWIVDYKTNRPPPTIAADIPIAYKKQMEAYRAVIRAIYPDKFVRCFLLWTYGAFMMEVA